MGEKRKKCDMCGEWRVCKRHRFFIFIDEAEKKYKGKFKGKGVYKTVCQNCFDQCPEL